MAIYSWSVLCRRAVVDKDDNSISLFDILEGIKINEKLTKEHFNEKRPTGIALGPEISAYLVSLWMRNDVSKSETGRGRVTIKSPSGKILGAHEFEINLQQTKRARTLMKFPAIPFVGFGIYTYIVQQKETKSGRWITEGKVFFDIEDGLIKAG